MDSLFSLFKAYTSAAFAFAFLHFVFLSAYFLFRLIDFKHAYFWRRSSQPRLRKSHEIVVEDLTTNVRALAAKGYISDAETISRRLAGVLSSRDGIVTTLVNGMIVVGLLGTLYNLWRLGPTFWSSLIQSADAVRQSSENLGQNSIGVAFATSFFGLLWAIILSLVDSLLVHPSREDFIRVRTGQILQSAIAELPFSIEKSVVESVNNLVKSNENIEANMNRRLEQFTSALLTQAKLSTAVLNEGYTKVALNWETFLKETRSRVDEEVNKLETAASELSSAILNTRDHLAQCGNIGDLLVEVRTTSEQIIEGIGQRLEEHSGLTQAALNTFSESVGQSLFKESEASNLRLTRSAQLQTELFGNWQQRNVEILNGFRDAIEKTGSTIGQMGDGFSDSSLTLAQSFQQQLEILVTDWKTSLEQLTDKLQRNLQQVEDLLKRMDASSENLAQSADATSAGVSKLHQAVLAASAAPLESESLKSELVKINDSLLGIELLLKRMSTIPPQTEQPRRVGKDVQSSWPTASVIKPQGRTSQTHRRAKPLPEDTQTKAAPLHQEHDDSKDSVNESTESLESSSSLRTVEPKTQEAVNEPPQRPEDNVKSPTQSTYPSSSTTIIFKAEEEEEPGLLSRLGNLNPIKWLRRK